jgi:uncharacterized damage-inducible protein DinB
MDANAASGLKQFLVSNLKSEHEVTKKVIRAVPEDKKGYTPHPTSKNAGDLAWHIAGTELWFLDGVIKGKFDMSGGEPPTPGTIAEMADTYEKGFAALLPGVEALSGEHMAQVADFFGMKMPIAIYLGWAVNHTIHHRGQLSAYLRPMGAKVPSIYGGSADEPMQM